MWRASTSVGGSDPRPACYARLERVSVIQFLSRRKAASLFDASVQGVVAAAAVALLCVEPAPASAQEGTEPVQLVFRALPNCPDAAAFFRAVSARTPRVRIAEDRESGRTFHVAIHRTDDGKVMGDFSISDPNDLTQTSSKRTITGESCTEVCDALALFAALSIDPDAATTDPQGANAPSVPAERAQPTPTLGIHPRRTSRGSDRHLAADRRVKPVSTLRISALVGVQVGAISAGTPANPVLVEPFFEIQLHQVETRGIFTAPALRLGFSSTKTDTATTSSGLAHLHWTALRLDACPIALRFGRTFSVRPCLSASAGQLSATGVITLPNTERLPWLTVGGLIRGEWNFLSVLVLEADGGADAPLRRDQLYFEPSTPVYRAPAAMGHVSLGVSVHFL